MSLAIIKLSQAPTVDTEKRLGAAVSAGLIGIFATMGVGALVRGGNRWALAGVLGTFIGAPLLGAYVIDSKDRAVGALVGALIAGMASGLVEGARR